MNQKIFRRTFRPLLMSLPFVFAAGCAVDEGVTDEVLASDGDRSVNSTTVSSETNASEPTSDIFDGDVSVIVDDLNRFWEEADEELGFDYEPVDQSRVSTGTDGAVCNSVPIDPEEVEGNAYVDSSCAEGITVAYDPEYLGNSLAKAEATMAHEWGHVVQAQAAELDLSLDPEGLPIDAELQADCFAGAWAAERALAEIDNLGEDVFKSGDADDVEIDDPHAHGTPEERELSFQVGLEGGPAACIDDLVDTLP